MKRKPDVSTFIQPPKDPSVFLEGGAADMADRPEEERKPVDASELIKPEPVVQKLFRLRWDTANALKMGATQESIALGRRVTETEIVEALIRKHYKLDS